MANADVPAPSPFQETILGHCICLEPLSLHHMDSLWNNLGFNGDSSILEWLPWPKPKDANGLWDIFQKLKTARGFFIYAITGNEDELSPPLVVPQRTRTQALGTIGYLEVNSKHRTIEVGAVLLGDKLKRTAAATEAHYLILRNVLDKRTCSPTYRRVAWKNNTSNVESRRAAERIGYTYEGTWRNHMLQKGQSRNTDWLSITDDEWSDIKLPLLLWQDHTNFDTEGNQKKSLSKIRDELDTGMVDDSG